MSTHQPPPEPPWTISRACDFGQCVAVRRTGATVQIRDTAQPAGPVLTVAARDWDAFLAGAKVGDFDDV